MKMTFTKFDRTVEIDTVPWEDASEATREYVWNYGWKQSLQDGYAQATNADEFEGKLRKRYDAIVSGKMEMRESSGKRTRERRYFDEVAERITLETLALKRKSRKDYTADAFAALVKYFGERDRDAIEAEVAERIERESRPIVDDVSDIDLDAILAEAGADTNVVPMKKRDTRKSKG